MLSQKTSNMDVKKTNRNRVFRHVLQNGPIAKQDISLALNMSLPTVLQNVKELEEKGFLREEGEFVSTGGRRAKAVLAVPQAKMAAGLEIARDRVDFVLSDLTGRVVAHARLNDMFARTEEYFRILAENTAWFIEKAGVSEKDILGVGVAVPGIVDAKGDFIVHSYALNATNVSCAELSRHLKYPCSFVNSAHAAGLAELRVPDAPQTAMYLSLSDQVDGALLVDGALCVGQNQRGGNFGHMTLVPNGPECHCGKRGCVNTYCSARVLAPDGRVEDFFNRARAGDVTCRQALDKYMDCLATAANNLYMAFDCDVILGGDVGACFADWMPLLREKAAWRNSFARDGAYIKPCRRRQESAALGAALGYLETFVDTI